MNLPENWKPFMSAPVGAVWKLNLHQLCLQSSWLLALLALHSDTACLYCSPFFAVSNPTAGDAHSLTNRQVRFDGPGKFDDIQFSVSLLVIRPFNRRRIAGYVAGVLFAFLCIGVCERLEFRVIPKRFEIIIAENSFSSTWISLDCVL